MTKGLPRTTPDAEALIDLLGINRAYLVDEDAICVDMRPDHQKVTVTFKYQSYLDALEALL